MVSGQKHITNWSNPIDSKKLDLNNNSISVPVVNPSALMTTASIVIDDTSPEPANSFLADKQIVPLVPM